MAVHSETKPRLQGIRETIIPNPVQINPGEIYRLDSQAQMIRVVSGSAWISYDGRDIVLRKGRNLYLPAVEFPAVLSPIGSLPVQLNIRPR